jgi:lipopolysaccharide transport system permease protein
MAGAELDWTYVIRPRTGWFELHLSELWRYRDLTALFAWRDFVATYKQTILGPIWYIVQPLFTALLFTIVFGHIAALSTDGTPQVLFYLAGVTNWAYFSDCMIRTSTTFVANANIFGKVYFPRLCVPISVVISNLARFVTQFLVFIAFLTYFLIRGADVHPNAWLLVAPLLVILQAALGLGCGIIVSASTTRYRDFQQLVNFGAPLVMYACPVIYPLSIVPSRYRWLILANPMTPIIEMFRLGFLGHSSLAPIYLLSSAASTLMILLVGVLLFNRVERTFMDTV